MLLSGIHGDERGVMKSLRSAVESRHDALGDFLYIPEVCPSSVQSRTRQNSSGQDLNRCFEKNFDSDEVRVVTEVLSPLRVETCISFHEDLGHKDFYLYDSHHAEGSAELDNLRHDVKSLGVGLLDGFDDEHDEILQFKFFNGYAGGVPTPDGRPLGTLESWLIKNRVAKRVCGIEVPGNADQEVKDKIVLAVFENLVYNESNC